MTDQPEPIRITRHLTGATVHLPNIDYLDTQVWSADIGLTDEALRELRDAITAHLDGAARTTRDPAAEVGFVVQQFVDGTERVDMKRLTDGRVMCCVCFQYTPRGQLAPDAENPGCVIDVCKPCAAREAQASETTATKQMRDQYAAALTAAAHQCPDPCPLPEAECYTAHPIRWDGTAGGETHVTGEVGAIVDTLLAVRDDRMRTLAGRVLAAEAETVRQQHLIAGLQRTIDSQAADLDRLATDRDAADRTRAGVQADRDQHAAVLREVLDQFAKWPTGDPLWPGGRLVNQVSEEEWARWHAVAVPTAERPWWEQLDELRAELQQYAEAESADAAAGSYAGRAEQAETERDGAYRERAHLLAWLAALHPTAAVIAPAPDIDEPGWQILYLAMNSQQMSWHISPRDADLMAHVPHVAADDPRAQWDGHTTEQKYQRIQHRARYLGEDRHRLVEALGEYELHGAVRRLARLAPASVRRILADTTGEPG